MSSLPCQLPCWYLLTIVNITVTFIFAPEPFIPALEPGASLTS